MGSKHRKPSSLTSAALNMGTKRELSLRGLHDAILREVLLRAHGAGEAGVLRSDLHKAVCDALAPRAQSALRLQNAALACIHVLVGLKVLEPPAPRTPASGEAEAPLQAEGGETKGEEKKEAATTNDNVCLVLNRAQTQVLENVDHYSHAYLLFRERNAQLVSERNQLVRALIGKLPPGPSRSAAAPSSSAASHVTAATAPSVVPPPATLAGAPPATTTTAATATNKRRKLRTETPPPPTSFSPQPLHTEPLASASPPHAFGGGLSETDVPHTSIERQIQREAAVQRVRALQHIMHRSGGKGAVEAALALLPEKPKFVQGTQGPSDSVLISLRESKGPSSAPRPGNNSSNHSNGGNSATTGLEASPETAKHLMPGYEVELATQPIDFADIAAQFELWNGQDSDIGVSGRASPRPNPSPSPDGYLWPASSPSPPPGGMASSSAQQSPSTQPQQHPALHQSVPVPQWSNVGRVLAKPASSLELSAEEQAELHFIEDAGLLARHDAELETFRVRFEAEQAERKVKKRAMQESRDKSVRDIVAAAKANRNRTAVASASAAQPSASPTCAPKR